MRRSPSPSLIIGACEWVALPDLGLNPLRARVDTGARTSALHALNQQLFEHQDEPWIAFEVHGQRCQAPIKGQRMVRSSSGQTELRWTIVTAMVVGRARWMVEITLTNRQKMRYPMLLGRSAMKDHAVVYPAQAFLQGRPQPA
jgi:hypothetical protein